MNSNYANDYMAMQSDAAASIELGFQGGSLFSDLAHESISVAHNPSEESAGQDAHEEERLPVDHDKIRRRASQSSPTAAANAQKGFHFEFTKRRNWSQTILSEMQDCLQVLSPAGKYIYVTANCAHLTGFSGTELIDKYITDFIHPEDREHFVTEFNQAIEERQQLRVFYRFRRKGSENADRTGSGYQVFESCGHPHFDGNLVPNHPIPCVCFFMISRSYPAKNSAQFDSFLDQKTENERLRKKIAKLRESMASEGSRWSTPGYDVRSSETPKSTRISSSHSPPALTLRNLGQIDVHVKQEDFAEKFPRSDSIMASGIAGTGYMDEEGAIGLSAGNVSPALLRGDMGDMDVPLPRNQGSDRRKRRKLRQDKPEDEHVCTECGTLDSPEWRKGPKGPKTLCNACGLRFSKKEKRLRTVDEDVEANPRGKLEDTSNMQG